MTVQTEGRRSIFGWTVMAVSLDARG